MTPRGIKPIVRASRDPLTPTEFAAMPDHTAKGDHALLALEESLQSLQSLTTTPRHYDVSSEGNRHD